MPNTKLKEIGQSRTKQTPETVLEDAVGSIGEDCRILAYRFPIADPDTASRAEDTLLNPETGKTRDVCLALDEQGKIYVIDSVFENNTRQRSKELALTFRAASFLYNTDFDTFLNKLEAHIEEDSLKAWAGKQFNLRPAQQKGFLDRFKLFFSEQVKNIIVITDTITPFWQEKQERYNNGEHFHVNLHFFKTTNK